MSESPEHRFHLIRHGASPRGDVFDLYRAETALLGDLFGQWDRTTPERAMGEEAVVAKWDHGTVGKLLLEHAALRLAAGEELGRVVREMGQVDMADRLEKSYGDVRPIIDRMYDSGRGVQPISLAITPRFLAAVDELHGVLRDELDDPAWLESLAGALAPRRSELKSARYISRHAPGRPQAVGSWGRRFAIVVRLRTAIDRLAGFPWAESSLGDRKLAERFDNED